MNTVKRLTFGWICALLLVGCGGGSNTLAVGMGTYSGTVADTSTSTVIVEMTIAANGSITGTCALTKVGSAAIIGRCDLTGSINVTEGTFAANGMYYLTVPPPPGWSSYGPIAISGIIPRTSIVNNPVQVTKDIHTVDGLLNPL